MDGHRIQPRWIFHPNQKREEGRMSNAAIIDDARNLSLSLEYIEKRKAIENGYVHCSEEPFHVFIRKRLAEKLGFAPGMLENLARDRLKSIPDGFRDRARSLLIRSYEKEIVRLTHELEVLRQAGERPDSHEIQEVQACMENLHQAFDRLQASIVGRQDGR